VAELKIYLRELNSGKQRWPYFDHWSW